jgi:hypothetical protein
MTDEELKELVKNLIEGDRANIDRRIEAERARTESWIEAERARTESWIEAERARTESLIEAERAKTESLIENDRARIDRLIEAEREKTDRFIKALNKQMGELGRKFGGYTEGLAMPAMQKLLRRRFKMDVTSPHARAHRNGRSLEVDLLGYSRQEGGDAYVVEIKSRFDEEALQQVLNTLQEAPKFFPPLKDKRLYGIVAAVEVPENMRRRVLKAGLYLALVHDDTFKLAVPRGFKPKVFYDGTKGRHPK